MPKLTLTVETVTPLLMNGADQTPEVRAASFRGVFRYWLRAVLGARYQSDIKSLFDEENKYWGSTATVSSLSVRVEETSPVKEADFVSVWNQHERKNEMKPPDNVVLPLRLRFEHFTTRQEFKLTFSSHPLKKPDSIFTADFYASLLLAFTLGGFGKRSRRGGGKIVIQKAGTSTEGFLIDEKFLEALGALQTVSPEKSISQALKYLEQPPYPQKEPPEYPVFASNTCAVLLGNKGFDTYQKALDDVWQSAKSFAHTRTTIKMFDKKARQPDGDHTIDRWWAWGFATTALHKDDRDWNKRDKRLVPANTAKPYADGGRRTSAVHITAHAYQGKYYPLVTIFRSQPTFDGYHKSEKTSDELLKEFAEKLNANILYGDWIKS